LWFSSSYLTVRAGPIQPTSGITQPKRRATQDFVVPNLGQGYDRATGSDIGITANLAAGLCGLTMATLTVATKGQTNSLPTGIVIPTQHGPNIASQVGHLMGNGIVDNVIPTLVHHECCVDSHEILVVAAAGLTSGASLEVEAYGEVRNPETPGFLDQTLELIDLGQNLLLPRFEHLEPPVLLYHQN